MEVYIGLYNQEGNEIGANRAMILNADSFDAYSDQVLVFAGDGMSKAKSMYEEKKNLVWTSANMDWSVFAQLGDEKYKKGDFSDLVHGEPIYLKPPNITTAKISL